MYYLNVLILETKRCETKGIPKKAEILNGKSCYSNSPKHRQQFWEHFYIVKIFDYGHSDSQVIL